MTKVLSAAAAALFLCFSAGSASAQDVEGGAYGGIAFGRQMGIERDVNTAGTPAFRALGTNLLPTQLRPELEGITYGVILGNNFSSQGPVVWGIEIDVMGVNSDFKAVSFSGAPFVGLVSSPIAPSGFTTTVSKEYGMRGSLRGRIGTSVFDRVFVYGTGGVAFAHTETKASVAVNGSSTLAWNGSNSEVLTGWTAGVGVELQVLAGVILRGEYLYTDLGDGSVKADGNAAVRAIQLLNGVDYVAKTDYKNGEARAGLLFSF